MRIDFVIGSLQGGGAERVVSTLANYFANAGHEVRIITFRDRQDAYELHSEVKRIRFDKKLIFFNYALMRALVYLFAFYRKKVNRPDVISSHVNLMGLVTIPLCRLFKIKLTVSEHTNHNSGPITFSKWILWNIFYRFPNAVTILTSYDKNFFTAKNENVIIMPNPCSFPEYSIQKQREKIILAVGDLNRYHIKGFDNLLDVAVEVVKVHPDWKFMIVGGGDNGMQFLKQKAKELEIENKIIFAGFRKDVPKLMQSSAIFMLTSRYEGLPMGLMEAASQGMACIAFDCISGPSDIITDDYDGFLVKDQEIAEMVEKTITLIDNEQLRSKLGENAVKSSERFSVENIGTKWFDLFTKIISEKNE